MKKAAAIVLSAVMALSLAACGSSSTKTTTAAAEETTAAAADTEETTAASGEKEVLRVGLSADYPPFEGYTADDPTNPVGIDVEVAQYIADALGMELQITDMSFDGLLASLNEGKFDLVISAMTIDPERACLFSDSYFTASQNLIVKKGNEDQYQTTDDLKGKKIGGQMGAIQEDLATEYAGDTAQIVNNVQDMVMMVAEGQLDGLIAENGVATAAVNKNDELAIAPVEIPYEDNGLGVCAAEGNQELIDKINPIIKEMTEKGLVEEWQQEYIEILSE